MTSFDGNTVLTLGILLTGALVAGLVARVFHLPRVTGYLLVGLVVGPHALGAIPEDHLESLESIAQLAIALVLFNMGCHFTVHHFRRIAWRALRLSAAEIACTFVLVGCGLMLLGEAWPVAMLFGVLAIATAPATTVLVLKESSSEGPVTEYALALVALNNLVAIAAFEVLLLGIRYSQGSDSFVATAAVRKLIVDLAGSLTLGIAAGFIASYACGFWPKSRWLVVLVALMTLVYGIGLTMEVPFLLTFLAMGTTVANSSDRSAEIVEELDQVTSLLCVAFFAIHGAQLDLGKLQAAGLLGVAYIVLRLVGKCIGPYLAAEPVEQSAPLRRWLGPTLLSQAGAAISLSAIAADPASGISEIGTEIQAVILGTVVFFEIVGPLSIKHAVMRAGEVPLDQVIHHTTTTPWEEVQTLFNRVAMALGFNPWRQRLPEEVTVSQVMRRNVKGIPAAAIFDEVVEFIEHSHDNTFAVVGADGELVGVIRYTDLRDALFDPELGSLVCAADLALPADHFLTQNDPIAKALPLFRDRDDDCVAVVSEGSNAQLVGMLRRRDLFRFFLKGGPRTDGSADEQ